MWYKNTAGRFFGLVTKHACDKRTDGQTALAIATDNLRTKFEVSISTHYEDMRDDTKCRKWGGLG